MESKDTKLFKGDRGRNNEGGLKARMDSLECVSSGTIRRPKWILRQFKEETRRLSSAKSSLVTQKWRSDAEIAYSGIFETHSNKSKILNGKALIKCLAV